MAYKTKDQYARQNENAAKRMEANKEIASLTEEQHEALATLCTARHELHSNMDSAVKSSDNSLLSDIESADDDLLEAGLERVKGIPNMEDIDVMDMIYMYEDVPESDSDEYQEWYDSTYDKVHNDVAKINEAIEDYLSQIDSKYGTTYCPTGALRIF